MEGEKRQTQKGGSQSTNQQAGHDVVNATVVNAGLSVQDAVELARQLFQDNFIRLTTIARETATERAEQVTREFIRRLARHGLEAIQAVTNPDVQASLYEVQTSFARSGRTDLGGTLVNLLVERCISGDDSWEALILNDAIEIARRLHASALAAITVNLTITRATPQLMNLGRDVEVVSKRFANMLKPQVRKLPTGPFEWDYLNDAGVAAVKVNPISLPDTIPGTLLRDVEESGTRFCTVGDFLGEFGADLSTDWDGVNIEKVQRSFNQFATLAVDDRQSKKALLAKQVDFITDWRTAIDKGRHHDLADVLYANRFLGTPRPYSWNKSQYEEWYAEYRRKTARIARVIEKWAVRYFSDSISLFFRADPLWDDLSVKWMETPLGDLRLTAAGVAIGHGNLVRLHEDAAQLTPWLRAN